MSVIMVNWSDDDPVSVMYDPVKLGAAESEQDNCVYSDVYSSFSPYEAKGTPQPFPDISMHSHVAFHVKCLPW